MNIMKKSLLLLLLAISLTATAAHRSTSEEAKAMFDNAIATYQNDGKEIAIEKFQQKDGEFNKGDLYVFVIDEDGNYLASGANPELAGTSFKGTLDASGNSIYKMIIEALDKSDATPTVSYVWLNRQTNQVETKTSYVKKIDDVIMGIGFYH